MMCQLSSTVADHVFKIPIRKDFFACPKNLCYASKSVKIKSHRYTGTINLGEDCVIALQYWIQSLY